ncbi:hypothetical protein VKT23_019108 [Stygiomarasmius scandens]|uniref:CxC2-like cysteine cluster KDZ transposase-associated domain-containing protein n=1 Tax=Marasmiellus scandens TaxID=2682957 RepID=A0ABR1IMC6_9AGAR
MRRSVNLPKHPLPVLVTPVQVRHKNQKANRYKEEIVATPTKKRKLEQLSTSQLEQPLLTCPDLGTYKPTPSILSPSPVWTKSITSLGGYQTSNQWTNADVLPDKRGPGHTQNDYVEEYLKYRFEYLCLFMELAAPSTTRCHTCGQSSSGLYNCLDCFGGVILCRDCCRREHALQIFHRIRVWNGICFSPSDLNVVELVVHLGHSGKLCPSHEAASGKSEGKIDQKSWQKGTSEMSLVDVNGVYVRHVQWCVCKDREPRWKQLIKAGFFPASYERPVSAFSRRLLDFLHLLQMECKVATNRFFHVLRRWTNGDDPESVQNRYQELQRVLRCYRDTTSRAMSGFFHEPYLAAIPGALALGCTSCPQPGINAKSPYPEDPDYLWKIDYVIDGNFKLEQLRMRNPSKDVILRDGLGFMVQSTRYNDYMKRTEKENVVQEKSTCNAFNAQNNPGTRRPHLLYRGVASIACARHRVFVPHASANIPNGEQQRIIDYIVSEGLHQVFRLNSQSLPHEIKVKVVNLIYDIMCQYCVHCRKRLQTAPELINPQELQFNLQFFIGKFHLGCHKEECYALYTLDLLLGGGHIDGEGLESLWAALNEAKSSVRAMSEAHRQEFIDDLMYDSNFKKLLGGDLSLMTNWKRAVEAEEETRVSLEQMRSRLDSNLYQEWEREGISAQTTRSPAALKIYEGEKIAGRTNLYSWDQVNLINILANSFNQTRADLSEKELKERSSQGGDVGFLNAGLAIEQAQRAVKSFVHSKGKQPNDLGRWEISEKRQALQLKCTQFQERAYEKMRTQAVAPPLQALTPMDDEWWNVGHCQGEGLPESMPLAMPSSLRQKDRENVGWVGLGHVEFDLRDSMLSDLLTELHLLLGEKLMRYRGLRVDHHPSQSTVTRAWRGINNLQSRIYAVRDEYRRQVTALKNLQPTGTEAQRKKRWLDIEDRDLLMKTDWEYPGRLGQSQEKMAWFWLDAGVPANVELDRCPIMTKFYKVNYLKAHARWQRWKEEKVIVRKEMQWRIQWFEHAASTWHQRAQKPDICLGARCFALAETERWKNFADRSRKAFTFEPLSETVST